jgi:hypothetical protein
VKDRSAIPYVGHLLLVVARYREHTRQQVVISEFSREMDLPRPVPGATAGGDAEGLRGIPCIGRGVSGGIDGRPLPAKSIDRLDPLSRALAVLARDVWGTSPGTQPEEALLEKERLEEESYRKPIGHVFEPEHSDTDLPLS